jgi:hypothetical protein
MKVPQLPHYGLRMYPQLETKKLLSVSSYTQLSWIETDKFSHYNTNKLWKNTNISYSDNVR